MKKEVVRTEVINMVGKFEARFAKRKDNNYNKKMHTSTMADDELLDRALYI